MSWVARALPAKRTWTQPSRINWATCAAEPVCTIAGPPTSSTFFPAARVARMASTTPCTLTDLGFSLETVELMKPNRADLARPLDRQHAHPRVPDHDRHADLDADHRDAPRLAGGAVDHDPAVHLLVVHVDPSAAQADLGRLVGRAVEALGERAGDIGRDDLRVLRMDRRGAVLDEVAQDRLERLVVVGLDGDPGVARVGSPHADLALADLERSPHQQDAVEDLGQEQRVDDMAADLDLLDHSRRRSRPGCGSVRDRDGPVAGSWMLPP